MTLEDLRQLVTDVQRRCSELDNVEVKAARGGAPLGALLSAVTSISTY
ncbi:MAG TPA: hypothetical protein VNN62_20330 [Methylomirabilota bacterium]|nr:hypothetical protein [Methylomirabilota bacterium]